MNLPHCELCEDLSATTYIERVMAKPSHFVYVAVSRSFYNYCDYELYDTFYPRYKEHYLKIASEISAAIGGPVFTGDSKDEGFPEWAYGEHVTVWKYNGAVLWLQIHHEDKEIPIVIALHAQVT